MESSAIEQTEEDPSIKNVKDSQTLDDRFLRESQQFLSLFPKEVWDHICSFLHSQDFQNFNNSSPFFRELFLRKRIFLLFEPVMEILLPNLGSYTETPSNELYQDRNARSVLVNCRATCKSWKKTINKMASMWNEDKHKKKSLVHQLFTPNYKFKESNEIEEFLQYFKTTHTTNVNPFPGRFINLQLRLQEPDYPKLSKTISTLLQKYGQNLSTFLIYLNFGTTNPPEIHHKIVEWLNLMPNLQNLSIYYIFPFRLTVDQVHLDVTPPKLNLLRNLVIKTFSPALQDVHIHDWFWLERYNLNKLVTLHENLEFLQITMFNKKDAEILDNITSPLKTLVAAYGCKEDDVILSQVFTKLSEKFSKSLEDLTLVFRVSNKPSGHLKIMRDSFNGRLNLPKVRKVEIRIISMFCLDFLLGMQDSLEDLMIKCITLRPGYYEYRGFSTEDRREIEVMENKQNIQFLGYQDKMLESNIWSIFPNLRKICLENVTGKNLEFRRREWVKLQKTNLSTS